MPNLHAKQQSQILVPMDTPGVEIIDRPHAGLRGRPRAARGHMHMKFDNVRVPKDNMSCWVLVVGSRFPSCALARVVFTTVCVPSVKAEKALGVNG